MIEYIHNIFIVNSFAFGKRIAYDVVEQKHKKKDNEIVQNFLVKIYKEAGENVSLTNHTIVTNSSKWNSVCQKDSFFNDIKLIKKSDVFIEYIKYNNKLNRSDIVAFVLLMEEKMMFRDIDIDEFIKELSLLYMERYNKQLFDIFMYIDSTPVFQNNIVQYEDIIFDRIMSSEDGYQKLRFLNEEINKNIKNKLSTQCHTNL